MREDIMSYTQRVKELERFLLDASLLTVQTHTKMQHRNLATAMSNSDASLALVSSCADGASRSVRAHDGAVLRSRSGDDDDGPEEAHPGKIVFFSIL